MHKFTHKAIHMFHVEHVRHLCRPNQPTEPPTELATMKTQLQLLTLPILLATQPLLAAPANQTPGDAALHCAQVRLSATAYCLQAADNANSHANQCSSQVLTLEDLHTAKQKTLPQGGKLTSLPTNNQIALDSVVSHWACLKAESGIHYLYLQNTNHTGQSTTRLFTLDGKHLSHNLRDNTPARKKLHAKLGLAAQFEQGIKPELVEYKIEQPPKLFPPPAKPQQ